MRNIDLYWKSNREWWKFKNHIQVVKDDAPPEAKASYQRYLEQMKQNQLNDPPKMVHRSTNYGEQITWNPQTEV